MKVQDTIARATILAPGRQKCVTNCQTTGSCRPGAHSVVWALQLGAKLTNYGALSPGRQSQMQNCVFCV